MKSKSRQRFFGSRAIAVCTGILALFISQELGAVRTGDIEAPGEVMGWRAQPEVRAYDREGLFQYINGGAELYLSFGFKRLWVVDYRKPGSPDLSLNLFHMKSPEGAYGVFTAEREGEDAGVGEGSEYEAGLLRFYKGSYFGSIVSYPETPQAKEAVFALARSICSSIREQGGVPALVGLLPDDSLDPISIRYFWDHEILNHFHFISSENVLELGPSTRAVLAGYGPGGRGGTVLVVRYRDAESALRVLKRWLSMSKGAKGELNVQRGRFLILTLVARDEELVRRVVREVARRAEAWR